MNLETIQIDNYFTCFPELLRRRHCEERFLRRSNPAMTKHRHSSMLLAGIHKHHKGTTISDAKK